MPLSRNMSDGSLVRPRNIKSAGRREGPGQANVTKPRMSDSVRPNRALQLRMERSDQCLSRDREEADVDQKCLQEGMYGGRWCHPVRPPSGRILNDRQHPFAWMDQSLSDLNASARLASRVLAGIASALQENHSTIPRLFWAVNRGAKGILDLEEFREGLLRMHVLENGEVTLKDLADAAFFIDPDFDGQVNYPSLTKAITATQMLQRKHAVTSSLARGRRSSTPTTSSYGAGIPVDVVKLDKRPKSTFDHNKMRELFEKQQSALLAHHGERVD